MTVWRPVRLASLVLMLASTPSLAQVTCPGGASTWVATGPGLWSTPTNWSPIGVPASGADVCFITANENPTLPIGTTVVGTLNVLTGGSLTMNGGLVRTFTINGGINADGPFTFNSNITQVNIPAANQNWVINGSGTTFNTPIAPGASTTISVTGIGDLTLNSAAPGGFGGFNFGAALLVLTANGLGSGTPITLSGSAALVLSSTTPLSLSNPVTATATGELLAVDGATGIRHSLGGLTISPGQTLEELLATASTVQLQVAGHLDPRTSRTSSRSSATGRAERRW